MTDQAERGAAIVVRDLTKSYPIAGKAGTPPEGGRKGKRGARMRKHVLDGVSFTVPAGAIVSFLGHNGAGKTTLIRILSTLITADSGEVSIFSHDVKENPAGVRADIATTGQFAAIDENLTGRENLEFFGRLRGLDRAAAAARAQTVPRRWRRPIRVACGAASTSPRRCASCPGCCSSTNPRRGWIRSAAKSCGASSGSCETTE